MSLLEQLVRRKCLLSAKRKYEVHESSGTSTYTALVLLVYDCLQGIEVELMPEQEARLQTASN